ncbi:hypothetical protein SAMN05216417_1362 [Nitrosospira multiformis]|uniref:Uncharacterized protein n=1 Tax=Nitrosospira multiformis TaxID=1231 RepID=A0A1I7J003_9PROT|nr:hypothetical protein SAMN05216417_1362 [Nitrosospira multiformis]
MSPTHGPADVRQGAFRKGDPYFPFMFFHRPLSRKSADFSVFSGHLSGLRPDCHALSDQHNEKNRGDDKVIYSASIAKYFHNSNRVKSPQLQEGKITVFSIGSLLVLFASIMFLPCTPHFAVVEFARFRSPLSRICNANNGAGVTRFRKKSDRLK